MDTSDYEDEGFVINEIEVTSNMTSLEMKFELDHGLALIESKKPNDFVPRYMAALKYPIKYWSYAYRQESPIVTDAPIEQYLPEPEQQFRSKKSSISKPKEKRNSLYSKYFRSGQFALAYSRLPPESLMDPVQMDSNFASNYIQLRRVFDYNPNDYLPLKPQQELVSPEDTLTFDSNYQSGNLLYAFQDVQNPSEYHLILQNDTNSRGYTQWFNFSVAGYANKTYKFKIVNLIKRSSLFAEGMKPWMMSKDKSQQYAWRTFGQNISYQRTRVVREADDTKYYYQLAFDVNLQNCEDKLYIAMCPPYSYTKMIKAITKIKELADSSEDVQMDIDVVGHSISSNCVPMITIKKKQEQKNEGRNRVKPLIGFSARQHPGETWSSYLAEGVLKFLASDSPEAVELRQCFDFVIFPMINVDGVIYGNFRCDINGNDMNRRWRHPHKVLHSTIIHVRRKLEYLQSEQGFQFFFDLHGHSKKLNTFCYSCIQDEITSRIYPLILQRLDPGFYFPDCTFSLDQSKISTARAIINQLIKKEKVMTIECSFFSANKTGQIVGFSSDYMSNFAANILKALNIYFSSDTTGQVTRAKVEQYAKKQLSLLLSYQKNHALDSGSDSDPFEFELTMDQRNNNVMPKKQAVSNNRRLSKIKPVKLKTNQALSEKSNKIREESKELPEYAPRRPRRETQHNKTRPDEQQTKEEKDFSPRKYNRKVVSQIKEIKQKIAEQPSEPIRQCETEQSVVFIPSIPHVIKSFGPDKPIREDTKEFASCNLIPHAEKPLFHVARQFQRLNPIDKKSKFIRPINDNSLNSIDNFDSKFSDYLLHKNHQNIKVKQHRKNESETTRQIINQSKDAVEVYDNNKPLALVSQKLRDELETRRKRNATSRTSRLQQLPVMSSINGNKINVRMVESVKISMTNKGRRDTGLGEFSKIWKSNMRRYGKDID